MKISKQKGDVEYKTIKDKEGNVIEEYRKENRGSYSFEITPKFIKATAVLLPVLGTFITIIVKLF